MRKHTGTSSNNCIELAIITIVLIITLLIASTHFSNSVAASPITPLTQTATQEGWPYTSNATIDLGYEIYAGVVNASTGLHTFKGIRFAAPPTGALRWQAPQSLLINRGKVVLASDFGPACPHSLRSGQGFRAIPSPISEDCLFLNVYKPQGAIDLPVLVHIHGGGYGVGDGREDLSHLIIRNGKGFVGVSIQYRLGAFGFLAGDEVYKKGVVNAGLLDQQFALQWIQDRIHLFGGDPQNVTIFGISAGGGSSIAFAPYLPRQHGYNDLEPSQAYNDFATEAGCLPVSGVGNRSQPALDCLIIKDTETLQNASTVVSASGAYGTWTFVPVTDNSFIQTTPSRALADGKVNGLNLWTSNVVEEGFNFVPQYIDTEQSLKKWMKSIFPLFNDSDIHQVLHHYSIKISSNELGKTSALAFGNQKRANMIYGEATFICPSYWLAEAFDSNSRKSYKTQFSVLVSLHGYDGIAIFGNTRLPNHSPHLVDAMQKMLGHFVNTGNLVDPAGLINWPTFTKLGNMMVDLNQTGGVEQRVNSTLDPKLNGLNATWCVDPGLQNSFDIVNADEWGGGRGMCRGDYPVLGDLWLNLGDLWLNLLGDMDQTFSQPSGTRTKVFFVQHGTPFYSGHY